MARYIDAEKAKDLINQRTAHWLDDIERVDILRLINETPTADVQEVVRCKDCKYLNDRDDNLLRWCNKLICGTVKDDFFCADGERVDGKENENELRRTI